MAKRLIPKIGHRYLYRSNDKWYPFYITNIISDTIIMRYYSVKKEEWKEGMGTPHKTFEEKTLWGEWVFDLRGTIEYQFNNYLNNI